MDVCLEIPICRFGLFLFVIIYEIDLRYCQSCFFLSPKHAIPLESHEMVCPILLWWPVFRLLQSVLVSNVRRTSENSEYRSNWGGVFYAESTWERVSLLAVCMLFSSASLDVLSVYAAEVFPTCVRTLGMGSSYMASRLGSAVTPFLASLVSDTFLVYHIVQSPKFA